MRRYEKIINVALDRTLRRTCFGRGCGPVVRQTMWWTSGWWFASIWSKVMTFH